MPKKLATLNQNLKLHVTCNVSLCTENKVDYQQFWDPSNAILLLNRTEPALFIVNDATDVVARTGTILAPNSLNWI